MKDPLVSIVIPTYNCANYLPLTIASILKQTYQNLEIRLIDDGSTDQTADLVKEFGDKVFYERGPNSGGPSRPRNIGIMKSRGDFIFFFDSDDIMLSDKVKDTCEIFMKYPDVDAIFTDFMVIGEHEEVLNTKFLADYRSFKRSCRPTELDKVSLVTGSEVYTELLYANFIGTSSIAIRKDVFNKVGMFDENLKYSEDHDLWFRIARNVRKFAFIDKVEHCYRKRLSSNSHRSFYNVPFVIKVLEEQKKYIKNKRQKKNLYTMLHYQLISYAWGLQKNGEHLAAIKTYLRSLKHSVSFMNIKGLILNAIFVLIQKKEKNAV